MNPTTITPKPIVIVTSEITEKPDGNPTNSCSIIIIYYLLSSVITLSMRKATFIIRVVVIIELLIQAI
ncbi:hypothetical protein GLOIN_2v1785467 [Rhizophagus irregularis DAOM 181602=DAOM 197198]|uniref:Uncharacterized protein n=1 Tax=Rhizophagus irregularis (strain DAOM 181602 / DAOM 197198 / MUCL 43194) TaxID=747089 RepID=U9TXH5_RHIID|nr:hypothetical protein GLOIN_2v1785467 [Rhizophagus irregularis DAOM 181602=DAOM 197198]